MTDNDPITAEDIAWMIAETLAELEGIADTHTHTNHPNVTVRSKDGSIFVVTVVES